jgi:hypothetical protein
VISFREAYLSRNLSKTGNGPLAQADIRYRNFCGLEGSRWRSGIASTRAARAYETVDQKIRLA